MVSASKGICLYMYPIPYLQRGKLQNVPFYLATWVEFKPFLYYKCRHLYSSWIYMRSLNSSLLSERELIIVFPLQTSILDEDFVLVQYTQIILESIRYILPKLYLSIYGTYPQTWKVLSWLQASKWQLLQYASMIADIFFCNPRVPSRRAIGGLDVVALAPEL